MLREIILLSHWSFKIVLFNVHIWLSKSSEEHVAIQLLFNEKGVLISHSFEKINDGNNILKIIKIFKLINK